ncbi:MAG: hypothetical protein LBE99_03535 [Puniceicoccales bacterium]|nr:hypothetical protein [Puniceicoccales bacterium]
MESLFFDEEWISSGPCILAVVEQVLQETLGSKCAHFHTLIPINGLIHPADKNAQSLVLLFEHQGSNILFTGDATGNTLEAILGNQHPITQIVDEKAEQLFFETLDEQAILNCDAFDQNLYQLVTGLNVASKLHLMHTLIVSAISKRNRQLLCSVNLMMESHHGSDQESCNLWLQTVIKKSGCNFCGSISSADALESAYGHPRHLTVIGNIFPPSARGLRKSVLSSTPFTGKLDHDRFIIKIANTSENVFQTALVDAYQFLFNNNGMSVHYSMANNAIESQLTSTGGLSAYSRNFWEIFLKGDLQPLDGAFLHGAFSAINRLFTTRHITTGYGRNTPALLTVYNSLQYEGDKQLLLDNAREFCSQFALDPLRVFGVSREMLTPIGPDTQIRLELPPVEPTAADQLQEPAHQTNYMKLDVPNDGNCGIAAILRGLNPQISPHDLHQQISELREVAAACVPLEDDGSGLVQEQKTRIAGWKKWLAIEDFQYIAQAVGQPIVVITNVGDVWNYYRFTTEGSNHGAIPEKQSGVETILDESLNARPECLFVYYESNDGLNPTRHFQAIVHN